MSKEKYFVVSQNCDGEWSVSVYNSMEEVVREFDIDTPIDDYKEGYHPANDFTTMLDDQTEGKMLIRGRVLLPKPKEVVTQFEFVEEDE